MRRQRGVTLIELLIVVAILALLVGASLASLVAPMKERAFAERTAAAEAGINLALASLVGELHGAAEVEPIAESGYAIRSADGTATEWRVDDGRTLRVRGAAVLADVAEFSIASSPDKRTAAVRIRAEWTLLGQDFRAERSCTVAFANSWTGGRP